MSKIWKSLLAKKLTCPAYKPSRAEPGRMEVYRAMHEQIRLQNRMKMMDLGWQLLDTEVPIENSHFKGKIDDIFKNGDEVLVAEYVSSPYPAMYKICDAAISAGYLRFEHGVEAGAVVISRGEITQIPDFLIERTWQTIESFQKLLDLDDDTLLEFVNPASGLCNYCNNSKCKRNPEND